MLCDICLEAGLPEGLFELLVIGLDVSDQIIEHPYVRGVTMTGSDHAGLYVGRKALQNLRNPYSSLVPKMHIWF